MRTIGDKEMDVLIGALRAAQESLRTAADALANMENLLCAPIGDGEGRSPCVTCAHKGIDRQSKEWHVQCLPCRKGSNWERKPW